MGAELNHGTGLIVGSHNVEGTPHRAAFRLCLANPASLASVVSQDGSVKCVHQQVVLVQL